MHGQTQERRLHNGHKTVARVGCVRIAEALNPEEPKENISANDTEDTHWIAVSVGSRGGGGADGQYQYGEECDAG